MTEEVQDNTGDSNDTIADTNDTVSGSDGGSGEPAPASSTEFNWRKEFAGEDEKALKRLERFASPKDFFKSYGEAEKRIKEGFKEPSLPENATEEQINEYRKQIGVPDSVTDYKLNLPEGVLVGSADKPLWDMFLQSAHGVNLTQKELDKVAPAYYKMEQLLREQQAKDAKEAIKKNESTLRDEWGADYNTNLTINQNFIEKEGGDLLRDAILGGYSSDGSPLSNNPAVAKFINQMARISGFNDGMAYNNDGEAQSVQDQIDAIMAKRTGANREQYYKQRSDAIKADDKKLAELYEIRGRFKK